MYQLDWIRQRRSRQPAAAGAPRAAVRANVWYLGFTSLLTDISSEMVNAVLPLYLVSFLRLNPLQFGIIDGLYQGVSAILRIGGGMMADRWRRYKETAAAGYAISAICKLGLIAAGSSWRAIATVIAIDRSGKGLRTAPRDALISLSSPREGLARSFGVHRALDAAGAMGGPLVAYAILWNQPDGYDVVFVASFFIAIVGLSVLALFVENTRPIEQAAGDARAVTAAAVAGLLRHRPYRRIVIASSVLALATVSDAFVFLTLQQRGALPSSVFPLLYVATLLVYAVAAAPAGRIADRWGSRRVFLAGYVVLGIAYAALLASQPGLVETAVALAALGVYYAATDGVVAALASANLPPAFYASGLGVLATCTSLARLCSSVIFGWVWRSRDITDAVVVFVMALAAAWIVAAIALSRVGRNEPSGERESASAR